MRDDVTLSVGPPAALDARGWDDVWALTQRYVDTTREYVESKLRHYSQIALFRTADALVGVSALDVYSTVFEGKRSVIIFTSSVVIDERYRRRGLIQRLGARTYLRTRLRYPFTPLYWLFDTFSVKSYLLLARNFADFWPARGRPVEAPTAAFIDHLARERYGESWVPERGVVVRSGQKKLRPHAAPITNEMLADDHVRFFVHANPGHADGDMLVCLCPLTVKNWLHVLHR